MSALHRAYVALGANLGAPVQTVHAAVAALTADPDLHLLAASSLYRTAPIGLLNQPDFINAVVSLETALTPFALLDLLLNLEADFGRIRHKKNGPRSLDLDLLLYDQICLEGAELVLPHPRLHLRAFVIEPLCEISPDIKIPGRGCAAAWRPALANQSVNRLS